ncbi:MAG TPA: pectin acetylesterase-family hydrolase [Polyangiaceae bacterium]
MHERFTKLGLATLLLGLGMLHCGPVPPPGTGGAAGQAGTAGVGGQGGSGAAPNTNPGFVNLAPPMGAALPATGTPLTPAPPAGWTWYQIDGAMCRDGSPTGFYVRYNSASDKLLVYLEGGGACVSPGFCTYNPANVNQVLAGDGQTSVGSIGGAIAGRQQPYTTGMFDENNLTNPYRGWNKIYVPYCTGDVHFGSRPNATLPGLAAPQQFVGYSNMQKFVARWVPTFQSKVNKVMLTGTSAGSFAAGLNYSLVQDSFGSVRVDVIMDSGVPFDNEYMPVCMQQKWRANWNLNASLPPDCTECRDPAGGNLLRLADFLIRKHPNTKLGVVSAVEDDIMRLFFSISNNNCATYETADPVLNFLAGIFPGPTYHQGLDAIRTRYASTGRLSTYYLGGPNTINHQHLWRPRFYEAAAGGVTIAQWATNFGNGQMTQVGP